MFVLIIEKLIRKRGKEQNPKYEGINVSNYWEIVRDLIGIRILVLSKEEWEKVFNWICLKFSNDNSAEICMAERPVAYTRYGDRDIFKGKIYKEHTNKGYRSQHYIVKYQEVYCEIQVRTLAEEVYGEFDHKVKYPYRDYNRFLRRYTNSMAQLTDAIDEMMSTCLQLGECGWEHCNTHYEEDQYVDWKRISQKVPDDMSMKKNEHDDQGRIDMKAYAEHLLLRKD